MSADALLSTWARAARRRSVASDMLVGAAAVAALLALAWRLQGIAAALAAAGIGIALLAVAANARARRYDGRWIVRRLDAERADMEDSADLLLADDSALGTLQRLQRDRLQSRLDAATDLDLRPGWSGRRLFAAWLAAGVAIAAILLWPSREATPTTLAPSAEGLPAAPGVPRLVGQRLHIRPPAYTGLPPRDESGLDAKAPQGSILTWTLRFAPQPAAATLAFHDGRPFALRRSGADWSVNRTLDRSTLYRVSPAGGQVRPAPPLHRLDAIPDTPPRIKVVAPDRGLSLVTPGQKRWALSFEASDDYGVQPTARLRIVLAQGEGENIKFRERTITVNGSGGAKLRRFAPSLDLGALGFTESSDLIVQLLVSDNRSPGPQPVRGPSLILRWPSNLGKEGSGLEGMVKKILPAYFRSQRQIIIDTEALIKVRRKLTADAFATRSNVIGIDQSLLRLRYAQFLGQETEGEPEAPTNDAPTGTAPVFGSEAGLTAEYGHTHDEAEAATLLDPETRATLKQAVDNMWQSEGNLRQGRPQQALPFAYKALRFIKEVQQATRIYLARVGPDLPPIDETRRMTGKREGLASRTLPLLPQDGPDAVPAAVWRALGGPGGAPGLDQLERWLRDNEARVPDPLSIAAAIDAVRGDPACVRCRLALRGRLWTVLSRPPAQVARRPAPDAAGRRYLDALASGR